jgi:hypothetical protein
MTHPPNATPRFTPIAPPSDAIIWPRPPLHHRHFHQLLRQNPCAFLGKQDAHLFGPALDYGLSSLHTLTVRPAVLYHRLRGCTRRRDFPPEICREEGGNLRRSLSNRSDGRPSVLMSRHPCQPLTSELNRAPMSFSVRGATEHIPAPDRTRKTLTSQARTGTLTESRLLFELAFIAP